MINLFLTINGVCEKFDIRNCYRRGSTWRVQDKIIESLCYTGPLTPLILGEFHR